MAVFGEPGMGKTTFLLLQILQHIRNDEAFIIIDPHGDLAKKTLAIIPPEKWERVVYIDPTTVEDLRSIIKIALLECKDPSARGAVAMGFVDSLKKMYEEFWGPRLEKMLINAIYAVMEQPEPKLIDVYDIITDADKRDRYLANVRDELVIKYWMNEFPNLRDDAPTAVTNKICRLIQERLVAPMFDCAQSSVDFGWAMNNGAFIIVNLSEGKLTTDVANFVGALLLNKLYQEGMARERIPESERPPFYIYIDEAHRFVTSSIKDILQALRKYKVYMTLAAQYLGQFDKQGGRDRSTTEAIPQLSDALVTFAVGGETAQELEPYFKPIIRHVTRDTLMTLQRHQMAYSIRVGGKRYVNSGVVIDVSRATYSNPDDVIRASLGRYGQGIDPQQYQYSFASTPIPDMKPIEFFILSYMYYKREEKPTPHTHIESEMSRYGFTESDTNNALRELIFGDMVELQTTIEKGKLLRFYTMTERSKVKFRDAPRGQRGGGPEHTVILGKYVREQRQNGFYCIVDRGDPRHTLPDVIVFPPAYTDNKIHPKQWDHLRKFAVEIESDPYHHREQVISNWEKCLMYGMPVNFITTSFKNKELIIEILSGRAFPVQNLLKDYAPGNIQVDTATATGELIYSEEESHTMPTEVEHLISEMRGMSSTEKFIHLTSRGWKPYLHTRGDGRVEVHVAKGKGTLYVGHYGDLKQLYAAHQACKPTQTAEDADVEAAGEQEQEQEIQAEEQERPAAAGNVTASGAVAPTASTAPNTTATPGAVAPTTPGAGNATPTDAAVVVPVATPATVAGGATAGPAILPELAASLAAKFKGRQWPRIAKQLQKAGYHYKGWERVGDIGVLKCEEGDITLDLSQRTKKDPGKDKEAAPDCPQ